MYAVLYLTHALLIPGLEDGTVYLFNDEFDANEFLFEKLVEAGRIVIVGDDLMVDGELCRNQEDAIAVVQDAFEPSEWFHAFKSVDKRDA